MGRKRLAPAGILTCILVGLLVCVAYRGVYANQAQTPDAYFSFTAFSQSFYDEDTHQASHNLSVYEADLQGEAVRKVFEDRTTSFSPLGVYDKHANAVYYVNSPGARQGDRIYRRDLETGADRMLLTEGMIAINDIVPVEGAVFFLAARSQHSHSLVLGKIDLLDDSVQYWDEPAAASTRDISVDRHQKRIYVALYDADEEDALWDDGKGNCTPPNYTICSYDYDLGDKREILRREHQTVKAIYAMDNQLLYRVDGDCATGSDTVSTTEVLDINTMETVRYISVAPSPQGCFSLDGKGIYEISDIEHDGINYYDFETEEITQVLQYAPSPLVGSVANFMLMYE